MSNIGICEYVIGVVHNNEIMYYVGQYDYAGKKLRPCDRYSSFLVDAKRYADETLLIDDLVLIPENFTRKVFEIQRCPKCKKEFTEHPAISRDDNETEICPKCGTREAVEAFLKATSKGSSPCH